MARSLTPLLVLLVGPLLFSLVLGQPQPRPGEKTTWTVTHLPPNCKNKTKMGDFLTTEYVGYFRNGVKFDATYDRDTPMSYVMGAGTVVKGAEESTMDMCVGEKRHVLMPPSLAYGYEEDYGQIPKGSWLVFDTVLTAFGPDPNKKSEEEMYKSMGLKQKPDGTWSLF